MPDRIRGMAVTRALLVGAVSALALSACGGGDSNGQARSLLKQTFGGAHKVDSGNLSFSLAVNPSGSSTITTPITVSFGGPFQSLGSGKLPESNFTITISGVGKSSSVGLLSTGQSGFVSLSGTSYQMPSATFRKLEQSFAGLTSSAGAGATSGGALARLGIDPLRWLVNPSIAGDEVIAGTGTTHIKAGVNVAALLGDLNVFLQKASAIGIPSASRIPTNISAATAHKIANAVKNPRLDVWTGRRDRTLRKLTIQLTLQVSGPISTALGGLRSADVALSVQYASLNQPQTITAPSAVRPFNEFTAKLKGFEQALQGALGGAGGITTTRSGTAPAPSTASPSSPVPSTPAPTIPAPTTAAPSTPPRGPGSSSTPAGVQAYSRCIQAAGSDVAKLQGCAGLLHGK